MADKEAVVYIVDLGSSMADCHNGRIESDLDFSMRWIWDKISTTVAAARKTWNVGVIGVRTNETNTGLEDEDGYDNIAILQELQPMDLAKMRYLQTKIKPSDSDTGDCVSALIPAIQMIEKVAPARLKFNRKIFMVTSGEAPLDLDPDDISSIAEKLQDNKIQLTILGVDFDDAEYGFKEEDKTEQKATNERLLKSLVDAVGEDLATFGTIAEAVDELDMPRLKQNKPYKTYDGDLVLGEHAESMRIHVERYFKTKRAAPPTASNVVLKVNHGSQSTEALDGEGMEGVEYEKGGEFAAVKNARTYKVNDPDGPGGKRDVDFEDLAKGYAYGQTAVHISESEFNITKLETTKGFSIIGFIQQDKFEPFLKFGESCVTVAQKNSDADALKLSSLIHSLHENESYALARLVKKDGNNPELVLLAPHIDVDFECLYDIPMPFAEDVRQYPFPPLDKVVTVQNNVLTKHRFLPSEDLLEAMDEYVDAMDISTYALDDEGERTLEYAAVDDTFSPPLHRVNQVVRHRAIHADKPVPPMPPILVKYRIPDHDLVEKAKSKLDDLIATAEVKKVETKAKGKRGGKQEPKARKPLSGLDVDALLREPANKRTKVDPDNAIPSFKQLMESSDNDDVLQEAPKQMGAVIRDLVSESFGDLNFDRATENLGVLREYMILFEEPQRYNDFLKDFKKRLFTGALGGDRREFWFNNVRKPKLGLIDTTESEFSKVTTEEAAEASTRTWCISGLLFHANILQFLKSNLK
ncbi:ATP-dependent DNA helicase II subunit 2 [Pestalotiopsis fici W106-1]|uniref:ATP-dependent DNA helicase II subunit 2 n=1 Tax=Pestalotiopsis fici (strain W106-1 / CGMCC3.15140) TaxID=1229662 RepID=W3X1D1_PESFW|nr:ATP-dependent DNA helicase II subunit 2 [Pestalotiopsis fici W106-1]ETS79814.1 ATP-dependent DNA helicase II subunit 2 [Pestalotiopsis fici W106-1]